MGIEDLFGHRRNQQRYGYGHHYENDDHNHISRPNNQQYETRLKMINGVVNNPKIRMMLVITGIVIIAIALLLIILLFPLLIKLFNYLTENGVQGIIDAIWKGTK